MTTESVPEAPGGPPPEQLLDLGLEDILPDPDNPRPAGSDDDLRALGESMLAVGQQQPVTVYRDGDKYRLGAGHRRRAAAVLVGMATLKAVLMARPVGGRLHLGRMAENKARKNPSPAEDVAAVAKARHDNPGMTNKEIATHTGYSEADVSRCLAVAAVPEVRAALADGRLASIQVAYAVARADPAARAGLMVLNAAGASSHAVIAAAKPKAAEPDQPGRSKRVAIPLPRGHTVVAVTGEVASLDGLINVLTEALELARKAHREAISLATAQRGWADKARAGGKPAKKGV